MFSIMHRVGIKAGIGDVYRALSSVEGVAEWWSRQVSGASAVGDRVNLVFHETDGTLKGEISYRVTELLPDKAVQWQIIHGPAEWIGTQVSFDLKQAGEYVIVLFRHHGWVEQVEFMAHCSTKWAIFLMSLKSLLETGQGRPAPDDAKIDDWN